MTGRKDGQMGRRRVQTRIKRIIAGHLDSHHSRKRTGQCPELLGAARRLGVGRVVQDERDVARFFEHPFEHSLHLAGAEWQPVREDDLDGGGAQGARPPDPGQAHLTAHVARPDLEGSSGPPGLLRHQFAQCVKFIFFQGVELPGRPARVDAGQPHFEQHVKFDL